MKLFFLIIFACLAFSSNLIQGMEGSCKRQTITEQPPSLPIDSELFASLFSQAVRAGDEETVERLLDEDFARGNISLSELHETPDLQPILDVFPGGDNLPPLFAAYLHIAAALGHNKVAQILISHDAPIDILDSNGMTPLMWAAQKGELDTVKFLMSAGADVDIRTAIGNADVFWIAFSSEPEAGDKQTAVQAVIRYLVECGWSDPYLLNHSYILEQPHLVARVLAQGGLITWPQEGDRQEDYYYSIDGHNDVSPLEWAKHRNLPCYELLLNAHICDKLVAGARAAHKRIFTALCVFQQLKETFKLPISRDIQRRILCRTSLAEDVLKGAAYVKRERRRDYEYLMETIQMRCGKLFSVAQILAFFVRNSH